MSDSDNLCPLCCEEFDISDRQFFPCKCGYQVCMWCWHRIRESESGLCPACRTPYGDDPHEFSAVDVEEVLKANKAKEAAAKKERERMRQQSTAADDGINEAVSLSGRGPMDLPKDRTQLANMRVIRRNLVYAVGLPPGIASEDTLRKGEYFGQYGKISKIVLNRNNATTADLRRSSASAYVTFAHKEDTLACILALDGFFIDGRNVRASYGTSKYCSAFIKNVRCNNPECTYLHSMGDAEDTFTKQEIQAGYVTSGRDVLAKQQKLSAGSLRRKVGGGGPSGTGRASVHPLFPPPTYDDPPKPSTTSLVPNPNGLLRSVSAAAAYPGTTGTGVAAAPLATKVPTVSGTSPTSSSSALSTLGGKSFDANKTPVGARKTSTAASALAGLSVGSISGSVIGSAASAAAPIGATAASVVAGVHTLGTSEPQEQRTSLTQLTPLKRSQAKPKGHQPGIIGGPSTSFGENDSQLPVGKGLNGLKLSGLRKSSTVAMAQNGTVPTSPSSSISSSNGSLVASKLSENKDFSVGSIGGSVIVGPSSGSSLGAIGSNALNRRGSGGVGALLGDNNVKESQGLLASLGGELLVSDSSAKRAAVGPPGSGTKWNGGGRASGLGVGGAEIWGSTEPSGGFGAIGSMPPSTRPGVIGGGMRQPHGKVGAGAPGRNNGSSALASLLGINLPTGSTSLSQSPSLWNGQPPHQGSTISMLYNNRTVSPRDTSHGVIGGAPKASLSGPHRRELGGSWSMDGSAGGATVGSTFGGAPINPQHRSRVESTGSSSGDIALLQSLLPGVHITSGEHQAPKPTNPRGAVGMGAAGWKAGDPPVVYGGNAPPNWNHGIAPGSSGTPGGGVIGPAGGGANQGQNQHGIW